eukprot:scaffold28648_cov60-Phaeocystis_antarctica.AAC.1
MSVTLEVSKLSGWLNFDAYCRGSKQGHAMRGEVQTGRTEVAADRGARSVQERARLQIGSRAWGGAHVEHAAHGCDAGGVEAQRLVERRRELPRVERRACDAGRGADREAGGGGRPRLGAGHGEERTRNMPYMVVTLEVSKLNGWLNALAYCKGSKEGRAMRGEVQTGRTEVAADRSARSVQERARLQIGSRAWGGAHVKHAVHVCDAGGVEAQRLVERRRVPIIALPSREKDMRCGARRRPGGRRCRATVMHAACRSGLDCRLGAGHGEERTLNMERM